MIPVRERRGTWRPFSAADCRGLPVHEAFACLDRVTLEDGEFFLGEMGPNGPISWSGVAHEWFWHGDDGQLTRPARSCLEDIPANIVAREPDRLLLLTMFATPVTDPVLAGFAFEAVGLLEGRGFDSQRLRFANLADGRNRPGYVLDDPGAWGRWPRLPHARIDDVPLDSTIHFVRNAPVFSAETLIDRAFGIMLSPAVLPSPPRPPGMLRRLASVFQGGG